jgi:hypothetical protein
VNAGATISRCGKFRYSLTREWLGGDGVVAFIMLNPSTADAMQDDPTIRRCIGFAKGLALSGLEVVNLYAFRATRPADMFAAEDPVGPENDAHIAEACTRASLVIAAWGANAQDDRVAAVRALVPRQMHALALSNCGRPRHPLYVRGDAQPIRWPI